MLSLIRFHLQSEFISMFRLVKQALAGILGYAIQCARIAVIIVVSGDASDITPVVEAAWVSGLFSS